MKEKARTTPSLLEGAPLHQAALAEGTKHYWSSAYNVMDHFKGMSVPEIREELQKTSFPYAVCMEHIIGDFNLGTVIRNANAFNAREVFYIGDKRRDRRSEVGVSHYTDVSWISSIDSLLKLKEKYYFIGVDNIPGALPLNKFNYDLKSEVMFIFGEEGVGLTPTMQKYCDALIYIEQFGSVRSLNVGTASGIIFNDFVQKIKKLT